MASVCAYAVFRVAYGDRPFSPVRAVTSAYLIHVNASCLDSLILNVALLVVPVRSLDVALSHNRYDPL
jgi:hypothetical protein